MGRWCKIYLLKWIKDDTPTFGGGRVSIMLDMPSIKGLLHKASIESAPNPCGLEPKDATSLA
jgi:carboxylesterase type B